MIMRCRKCKRTMDLWEFLTYVEAFLIRTIIAAAVPFIMQAIKEKLLTRGAIDSHMAGLANNFEIVCPHCKKYVCWDSAAEIESIPLSQERESETCK
jgi:hypothetical protein